MIVLGFQKNFYVFCRLGNCTEDISISAVVCRMSGWVLYNFEKTKVSPKSARFDKKTTWAERGLPVLRHLTGNSENGSLNTLLSPGHGVCRFRRIGLWSGQWTVLFATSADRMRYDYLPAINT